MLCERCKIREANIQYTEVINGVKTEHHFCAQCAKEMDFGAYSAIFDVDVYKRQAIGTGLGRVPETSLDGAHGAGLVSFHIEEVIVTLISGIGAGYQSAGSLALLLENHGRQHVRIYSCLLYTSRYSSMVVAPIN